MTGEKNQSNEKETTERSKISRSTKLLMAMTAINLVSLAVDIPDIQKDLPKLFASDQATTVEPRELIKDTHVIVIERVNGEEEPVRYDDAYIGKSIRSAKTVLEDLSKDALTLPENPAIHHVKLTPDGLYTNTESQQSIECYSDEQLDRVQTIYLKNNQLPEATSLMTVLNQGESCSLLPVGGAAAVDNINGMRIGTIYAGALTDNVILHEVGHVLGLSHAASLYCDGPTEHSMLDNSKADIGDLVGYGCEIPTRKSADGPDMYSDHATVMGGILDKSVDPFTERFNSNETVKLAPNIAKSKDVLPEDAIYELSTHYEKLRTITFTLPTEHPLRKIDADIDKLSIGLIRSNFSDKPHATVQVIAHHEGQSYRLANAYPFIAGYDEGLGPVEVYHDETLGVRVIIHAGENQNSVKLAVEALD